MNTSSNICRTSLIAAVCMVAATACDRGSDLAAAAPPAAPPAEVTISRAIERPVVEWDVYTGRIDAAEYVEIRARVSGYLDEVRFRDGGKIDAGDVLYVIDKRPYEATLAQADAEIESVNARLALAASEAARASRLVKQGVMPAEEFEQRQSELRNAQAALSAAKAARESARLNLEFTDVKAPISGRIDRTLVTRGNLVKADETLLTRIVSVDPMYVYFDVDERAVLKYRKLAKEGRTDGDDAGAHQIDQSRGGAGFSGRVAMFFASNRDMPAGKTAAHRSPSEDAPADNRDETVCARRIS